MSTSQSSLAQSAAAAPELDPEQIAMLRGLRKGTLLPTLLRTYREQVPQQLAAIDAALAAGDVAAVGGVAHSLKSASYSVGAKRLGDLCAAIEAAARGGDAAGVAGGCTGLAPAWALLQPEIEGHLSP